MSWPQYPLDESLERVYCSEFFGEIPESSFIHNLRPDSSFIQSSGRWFPQVASIGSTKVEESRNAAMAVGAGRAAGVIPQLGSAEAFNKVRTTTLPSSKWPATLQQFAPAYTRNSIGSDQHSTNSNYLIPSRSFQISGSELDMPTMSMLSDPQPLNENFILPELPGSTHVPALISEFDLCSSTVGMVRSIASHQHNSQVIPDRSTQRNIKLTGPGASCEPNALTMVKFEVEPDEIVGVQSMDSQYRQSLCTSLDMPSSQNVSLTEELHSLKASASSLETKSPYFSSNHLSTESVADAKEIVVQSSHILHPAELTDQTSSKRTNNEDIAAVQRIIKKAITPSSRQRKACKVEDFTDYECKDVQTESIEIKRYGSGRRRNSKRGRAAEVHNLSERRRRDRINERLRALQDLIPTSNKTDKASMLDEAVEYLKMLQLQLQIMSMRTGMIIPPMLITPKMQYLQPLVQMQMGTGTGLGMIDLATAAATTLPFTPYNPSSFEAAQCELYSSSDAVSRHMAACNPYSSLIDLTIPFLTRQQLHLQSQVIKL